MSSVTPLNPSIPSLPERWAACSVGRDGARHVQTDEALALPPRCRDLPRSQPGHRRTDADGTGVGSSTSSPSAVVSAVASLREAVTSWPEIPPVHGVTPLHVVTPTGSDVVPPGDVGPPGEVVPSGDLVVPAGVLKVLDRVLSEAIEGVSSSLREAALIDPLTGCANRRALREDLERAVAGSHRTGLDVAVAVIDLDGLKQINDTHGHAAGDSTLQDLSRALRAAVRDTDAVYRVGGDEFVVLIPFSGTGGAAAAMQRAKVEGAPTFSWGAASLSMLPAGAEVDQLIEMADASLYATRRNVRPISTARPRRHRTALAGAAAAAVVGLGVSSAFMLPSAPQQAAIGVPAVIHAGGSGGGHSSRTYPRTSVPSSSKSKPPASERTTRTEGTPSGLQASQVSETEPAVLTVAVSPQPSK